MEDRRLTTLSIPRNFFFVVVSEFQLNDAVLNFLLFPSDIDPLKKMLFQVISVESKRFKCDISIR